MFKYLLNMVAILMLVQPLYSENTNNNSIGKYSELKEQIVSLRYFNDRDEFEKQYSEYYHQIPPGDSTAWLLNELIYSRLAFYYYYQMNTDTIQKYIPVLDQYYEKTNNVYFHYYIRGILADAFITNGRISKGLEVGKEMLSEAKSKNEDIGIALSGHALAMAYMTKQDYSSAEAHFQQVIPILKKLEEWNLFLITSCNYMGVLIDRDKFTEAETVFHGLDSIVNISNNSETPFFDKTLVLYVKSIEASQLYLGLKDVQSFKKYKLFVEDYYKTYPDLPKEYLYQMKIRYAELDGDHLSRLSYADSLLAIYDSDMSNRFRIYKNKSEAYENLGRYKDALIYLKLYQSERDSVNSKEALEMTSQFSVEYDVMNLELDKTNLELELKEQQVRTFRYRLYLIAIFAIFITCVALYSLRLNRRLRKSLKMKEDFIHHITHEIKTPLNYLLGFGELITDSCEGNGDSDVAQMSSAMKEGGNELQKMIEDLIVAADLDSGKANLDISSLNLKELLKKEIERISLSVKKNVSLDYQIDSSINNVQSNFHALQYIVRNLLHNAAKFTNDGSIILSCKQNKGKITIAVFNNCTPIGKALKRKIFERFFKINSFSQGLGLGLYNSNVYADMLNAELKVKTDYAYGIEFRLVLPA